ncbi:MAG: nitrite reductase, copper-containing [Halobacteriovoraceae bacterium]|nr:nitrite reductase, copper-containing [Halobacteriovoraceae bacterium]
MLFFMISCNDNVKKSSKKWPPVESLPVEEAKLTTAPNVPPAITRKHPAKVVVNLETREFNAELVDGVEYTFWAFGDSVPGPMIRIREGDFVEFHLNNHPDSKMPHNIDLHAVTGQGGGAEGSFTPPGKTSIFNFRALNPGLYIYHCATAPVGMHIANGMYGLILVEPEEGLPPVDKEFYVVQSEFYTEGKFGEKGLQPFDMNKALKEIPDYVVFNGKVGALTDTNALSANIGDNVRIYFGVGGPNLQSNFHVIGEIFDRVYQEGGTKVAQKNVQTTIVPPGGSAMVEFKVDVPGTFILVDHAIFRAFNKGAIGQLVVKGEENHEIYTGKTYEGIYMLEGSTIQTIPKVKEKKDQVVNLSFADKMKEGKRVYKRNCAACHQKDGSGLKGAFPPIAKSDYLMANKERSIKILLKGLSGKITVNGETYDSVMPAMSLDNSDIASVLTYIRNSFGNKGKEVTIKEVKKVRKEK